jgi:hypothetical protein
MLLLYHEGQQSVRSIERVQRDFDATMAGPLRWHDG